MIYTAPQRVLHWLSAALIAIMAASGMAYYYEIGDDVPMVLHQIAGQALIVLLVLRVAMRVRGPTPAAPDHHPWERWLATSTHLTLYAILGLYVVTGYVAASAFSDPALVFPVDRAFARSDLGEQLLDIHYALKWVLLAAIAVHLAGVVKHALIDRDDTLNRMWTGNR